MTAQTPAELLRQSRDQLLACRTDPDTAHRAFTWPKFEHFNFASDWINHVAADERGHQHALVITEEDGSSERRTYRELSERSTQVAAWLDEIGVRRGDHVIVMLWNQIELWEVMLACIRIGAPVIPSTVMLGPVDLADRVKRGKTSWVVTTVSEAAKFDAVPRGPWAGPCRATTSC